MKKNCVNNFGGLSSEFSKFQGADFVIIPVPFEKTTTYLQGTKNAPNAIIKASMNIELYDEEIERTPAEFGIATLAAINSNKTATVVLKAVKKCVEFVLKQNKIPILIGGEHTISLGSFLALKKKYKKISFLQLDAHADLRDSYNNEKYSHACVVKRIREYNADVVQVGIRSLSKEEAELIRNNKLKIFFAKDIIDKDISKEIIKSIEEKNVYVSIDADVFDPSIIYSVGTPEPGGLGWYQTLNIIKQIAKEKNIVGFDFVEFCPLGNLEAFSFISAKFIYKIIGYIGIFKNVQ